MHASEAPISGDYQRKFEELRDGVIAYEHWLQGVVTENMLDGKAVLPEEALKNLRKGGQYLRDYVRQAQDKRFDIAVLGQMNVGKSTLLNALFLDRPVLPEDAVACTARLTFIEHGEKENAQVEVSDYRSVPGARRHDQSGNQGRLDVSLDHLKDYLSADGGYTAYTEEVRIQLPNFLDPWVRIVDTPGLFDPVAERSALTSEYAHQASAVVLILHAGQPFSREDSDFIRKHLLDTPLDRIIIVINKVDDLAPVDRDRVRAYVENILQDMSRYLQEDRLAEVNTDAVLRALREAPVLPCAGLLGLYAKTPDTLQDREFHRRRWASKYTIDLDDPAACWQESGLPQLQSQLKAYVSGRDTKDNLRRLADAGSNTLAKAHEKIEYKLGLLTLGLQEANRSRPELDQMLEDLRKLSVELVSKNDIFQMKLRAVIQSERKKTTDKCRMKVEDTAQVMRIKCDDYIGRVGFFNQKEHVSKLNMEMEWRARGCLPELKNIFDDSVAFLQDRIPSLFKEHLEEMGGLVRSHASTKFSDFFLRRMRYMEAADTAALKSSVKQLQPASRWKAFWGSTMRSHLTDEAGQIVPSWERSLIEGVNQSLDEYEDHITGEYIEPAIGELKRIVEEYKDQIQSTLKSKENEATDLETLKTWNNAAMQVLMRWRGDLAAIQESWALNKGGS
ncbi:dynamin family protein [Thermithiobacillus plumbiphilus]|uniref:Dynamin family protein n=1 Tax=Thermithiobacillus plumbiphilus TaxID=1729899 RepID=A0ABU9D5C6_9PROT